MNSIDFDKLVERRIGLIRDVLAAKGAEYATPFGDDRLHNFRRQAEMQRTTMAKTAWSLVAKQIVSTQDMIESGKQYPGHLWDEKLGDIINYAILIEAIVRDDDLAIQGMGTVALWNMAVGDPGS